MTITITTASALSEIKEKSHLEVKSIQDPEIRYDIEAGTEKEPEIERCIVYADTQLRALLSRYLQTVASDTIAAGITVPETLTYVLNLSERRAENKSAQLPQMFREYIITAALSKFYATVSATELASKRGNEAAALGAEIVRLIYFKNPPVL